MDLNPHVADPEDGEEQHSVDDEAGVEGELAEVRTILPAGMAPGKCDSPTGALLGSK